MAFFLLRKEVRTIATVDSLDIQISASVNTAVASLRQLNVQLNTLGTGLRNIGLTTNASFPRISESSRKLAEGFQKINKSVNTLTNGLKKTVKQLGKVATATVGIQKSIQKSMNYIETLNYFERAFEQVASKADLSAFSEMGYKSAEEYFNSFSERAKELTAKMSGFNVNVDGTLTASGMPSLGIDPNKLMNYQAMFAQMASSMGVASEISLKLSDALTMIGADLASVRNMDFDKVWKDMASGLVGMSRTLDKYGVNIRNVNLQQKLNELGIKANISALNQNDKALLRGIILLDSTRYAWGDLANTLNQPANQLRLIEGNIQNLSRTIGNLLLPVIAKILPYFNGFVIALQRLFTWLGKIFKIDLSNLLPKGGGGGSGAISDLIGDTGALEDGLNAATAAAKKLNKQVRAFDELNVINTSSAGAGSAGAGEIGSGLLDDAFNEAYQEYLDAWNDAFANVEDKAQGIADKIQAFFKDLFKPIVAAWASEGNRIVVGWKRAFQEIGKLVKDIGRDFMTMWQQQETVDIFKDIFHIIGDIGFIVGNLAENFRIAWNTNEVGLHIFENIRDVIGVVTKNIRKAADYTVQWSKTLDVYPILNKLKEWTESLVPVFDALSGMVGDFYMQALLPLGKWTLEKGLPELLDVATNLNESINWGQIRESLSGLNKELVNISKFTFTGITDFMDKFLSPIAAWTMNNALPTLVNTITDFSSKIEWEKLNENLGKFGEGLSRFTVGIGDGIIQFFQSISPFLTDILAELINKIGVGFGIFGDALNKIPIETLQALGTIIATVLTAFITYQAATGIITGISAALGSFASVISSLANPLTLLAAGLGLTYATNEEVRRSFDEAISSIKEGLQPALEFITNTVLPDLNNGWEKLMQILSPLGEFLSGMFVSIWQDMINPALTYVGETVLPKVTSVFQNLWNNALVPLVNFLASVLAPVIQIVSDVLTILWQNVVVPLANAVMNILGKQFEALCDIFNGFVVPIVNDVIKVFQFLWDKVLSPIVDFLWDYFQPVFEDVFKAIGDLIDGLSQAFGGLIDFVAGIFSRDWERAWGGIKDIFKGVFNGVISVVEGALNKIIDGLNFFLGKFNSIVSGVGNIIGISVSIPEISKVELPRLATGGIVYKPTYAEIGEAGKEGILPLTNRAAMSQLVNEIMASAGGGNQYDNGYNNYSEEASLLMSQNQLLREQNRLLEQILRKPTMEISDVHKAIVRDSMERGGNIHGGNMGRLAVAQELYR